MEMGRYPRYVQPVTGWTTLAMVLGWWKKRQKATDTSNSYAPAWLCRPSPGASLLTSASDKDPAQVLENGLKAVAPNAATRTIAKRGNEVFAVIDNEIRWSDLARLKDQWQQEARQKKSSASPVKEQTSTKGYPSIPMFSESQFPYQPLKSSVNSEYGLESIEETPGD
ncbi:hypothetical protein N7507_002331 [Penicillium longicatenatum]|nr:hypothetical protein N7507_002331 [Penicillium longicatenatum]